MDLWDWPETKLKPCGESQQVETFLYSLMQVVKRNLEFKTFESSKTFSLEDEQADEPEQNQVIKLISLWNNHIWEPGGVLIEHDKWNWLEKCYNRGRLMRLMHWMSSMWWKEIKSRKSDGLSACSCVDMKTWHCVKHETQQTDFHVWHRWKNRAEKLPEDYAFLEFMMLGLVSLQSNKRNGCEKTRVDQFKLVHATPRPGVYDRPLQTRVWDSGGSLLECVDLPEEYLVSMYLDGLQSDTQIHVRRIQLHSITDPAKGLCFFCNEKFTPEHDGQDKNTQLYTKEVDAETKEVEEEIDPDSTHNFIYPKIAEKLGCEIKSVGLTRVSVADGNKFGVQWLETLGQINWKSKALEMRFKYKNQRVFLQGIKAGSVKDVKAQKLQKLQENQVQLAMLCVQEFTKEEEDGAFGTLNALAVEGDGNHVVEKLVKEEFPEVFLEPKELPPFRAHHDHKIQLLKFHVMRAQHRMKQLADQHQTEREFAIGDIVYVKLQPYRQISVVMRGNQKLAPKFYDQYKVSDRCGVFVKEPELILEGQMVKRQGKAVTKVLIKWMNEPVEEATWEFLFDLRKKFPELSLNLEDKVVWRGKM